MTARESGLRVAAVPPGNRRESLVYLFQSQSRDPEAAADELIVSADRGEFPLDNLLVATAGGRRVGVQLAVIQTDGTAMLWPAAAVDDMAAATLMAEAANRCDRAGVKLAQCLRPPGHEDGPQLASAGFRHVSDLVYLSVGLDECSAGGQTPETTLASRPYQEVDADLWAGVMEATYKGSGDVPEAHGLRSAADAIFGYQTGGGYEPSLWHLFEDEDRPVGVAVITRHAAMSACEIAYLGVIPQRRGEGLGRQMLRSTLKTCINADAASAFVACDSRNEPALRLYRGEGFRTDDRHELWLRLRPHAADGEA